MPEPVVNLKNEISTADGVLLVTPEYNRSIPGVLKNIIDWGSRPYGNNSWANKPASVIGISPGTIGTAVAQAHLRSVMVILGAKVLGQPEMYLVHKEGMIDKDLNFTDEGTKKFLQGYLDSFSRWVELHNKK